MPVSRKAKELGAFNPDEIAMFWRVFDATKPPAESEIDADHRASRIIANVVPPVSPDTRLLGLGSDELPWGAHSER